MVGNPGSLTLRPTSGKRISVSSTSKRTSHRFDGYSSTTPPRSAAKRSFRLGRQMPSSSGHSRVGSVKYMEVLCYRLRCRLARSASRLSLFSWSNFTVVRRLRSQTNYLFPVKSKWSVHTCTRGLNKGLKAFVSGSKEPKSVPLCLLHRQQAYARLSGSVLPPCFSAIT